MLNVGGGEDPPAARVLAALPTAVGLHGTVSAFDPSQEEWSEYAERLVHYFVANGIEAEENKRAILLTAVTPGTYRLIKTRIAQETGGVFVRRTCETRSDSLQPQTFTNCEAF